jgi:Sugar (and other) transporter
MSNFVIAFITPPLFNAISGGYYFVLVGFCVISGVFVFFVYLETAHVTLEQLSQVFGDTVTDPERAETLVTLQLAPGKMRSTTGSEVSDASKLLLAHISDGSRASSSTAVGDIPLETSTHVNFDHPVEHAA